MGLVSSSFGFLTRLDHYKNVLRAPPLDPSERNHLRVGLDGDVPIFPPLAMIVLSAAAGIATFVSGTRLPYLPDFMAPPSVRGGISLALVYWCAVLKHRCQAELERSGTEVNFKPAGKVVADRGPYAIGRNMMYVALMGVPLAGSIVFDNLWLLVSGLALWIYLNDVVVPAEEKFLKVELGAKYEEYCKRVPRW
eukprot:CAMPEP_0197450044 /NCGR_PEP_ID=MMETSP1175-20131217/23791_1 /TAXON_ID=1003142 /ORGANISM="Triceratium dubium, Strain CCMP147" /LENGTH=193 /DNA_ID=CAMNT_0042982371 /DNA_START=63 /DNA_END=641 /DNA_ORIENTATION=+